MQSNESNLPSPCTSICEFDYARGVCSGCFRTLDEIARWSSMSSAQRRKVLDRAEARRAASD